MSTKHLDFTWFSQLDAYSTKGFDCGQVVIAMLLRGYGFTGFDPTPDALSAVIPGRTTAGQLVTLAARYGLPLLSDAAPDPETDLKAYIDARHPVVVLVNYAALGVPRPDLTGGAEAVGDHWFLIVGYDGDYWLCHDPLWRPSQREGRGGAYLQVHRTALQRAYRKSRLYHRQAKYPREAGPALVGLHGRADAGDMNAADIEAYRVARIEAAKLLSNHTPDDLARLRAVNPKMFVLVRLFESFQ